MTNDNEMKAHVHQFSMHLLDEESSKMEDRTVTARLPKWIWEVIEARSRYHHGGDLDTAFSEVMVLGINVLKEKTITSEEDVPEGDPSKWS